MTENIELIATICPDIKDLIQTALVEYLTTKRFDMPAEIEQVMHARASKIALAEVLTAYKKGVESHAKSPRISWIGPPYEVSVDDAEMERRMLNPRRLGLS